MAKDDEPKKPAAVVNNGTRVTVAFPFSKIQTQEPTEDLRELAAIVVELARQHAAKSGTVEADALVQRAQALVTQISH